ncbi:hypothetical protein FOXG_15048 [Fusarium oxysporum f. sp. lycopersici 4287]|uniref:Uncharacterized protein n=2 Tax=Fusarium oxysporum TaxID=5507 RepID=A0A0J9WUC5_FUSO4|nr:hypothetical protein FOXG_15048 [Fusarium oxysporum f. sp. lycopersici 4287]KNB17542.1 hypothetical protein FOXG_15048 [Fusarium oxysporum f. sp. lycopersici 4287]
MARGRRGTRTKRAQTAKGGARSEKRDRLAGPVPRQWRSGNVRFMSSIQPLSMLKAQSSDMTDDPDRPGSTSTNISAELYANYSGLASSGAVPRLYGETLGLWVAVFIVVSTKSPSPSFSPKRCNAIALVYGLIYRYLIGRNEWRGSA